MKKFLSHFPELWENIQSNVIFILEFIGVVSAIFVIAYIIERILRKKNLEKGKILSTRKIAVIGVMAAISGILMSIEIPVPFAPPFYKYDFSELPVLICSFAYGPVAGILAEALKVFVKIIIKGTSTAFVGDLANFVIGSCLILPATVIYNIHKSKKTAILGCIAGTVMMTIVGTLFNAVYLLPKFAVMYGMPMDAILAMGTKVNRNVNSITSFVILCVAPMNLMKGLIASVITMLIYQPLRPILKKNN